jgi:hypothetical protein
MHSDERVGDWASAGGNVQWNVRISPVNANPYDTTMDWVRLTLELVYFVMVLTSAYSELSEVSHPWSLFTTLCICILGAHHSIDENPRNSAFVT